MRAAEPEGQVPVRRARRGRSGAARGTAPRRSCPTRTRRPPCRPASIACPCASCARVAVRRKWCTGWAQRRSSSAAVPASAGSATSRARSSGCSKQREQAEAERVPRRLVAGGREQDEERLELALGQAAPVDLGLDELRRDVVARLAAPRLAELAPVAHQLGARTGSRTGACAAPRRGARARRRPRAPSPPGRCSRAGWSPRSISSRRSSTGSAHDLREHPHRQLGRDLGHEVELAPSANARVEDLAGEAADPLLVGVARPSA